jgi:RNA polymerase sigma-70 factor (ECF subfamily)
MLGDEDGAADAAQTAWLAAYRKLNEQRGGRFSSWLMRILTNACYDELRRRYRRGEVPLCPADDDGDDRETASWLLDHSPSVEQQVDQREMDQAVQSALQFVPAIYRSMIILVDIEGYGYEEAAAALRVPLGTVRSRVARGRIALRRQLQLAGSLPREGQQPSAPVGARTEVRYP